MANENLQMIYWQALSGGMPETLLAVFDYYERRMDDFRANARNLYGCRGILIPANTAPDSGLMKDLQPQILHWTGAAGWIGQHYWDYYLFTGDETFLRERALPFLRETALFYADFFVTDKDGSLQSLPSVSPENTPGGGSGEGVLTTINATMDFAIAREVLAHLIQGAETAALYPDETRRLARAAGPHPGLSGQRRRGRPRMAAPAVPGQLSPPPPVPPVPGLPRHGADAA